MLLLIEMRAKIGAAHPCAFDLEHAVVGRIRRNEESALVTQHILARLNVLRLQNHRDFTAAHQPFREGQREVMIGVNEVDRLALESFGHGRAFCELDEP